MRLAGVANEDLRIVVVRDVRAGEEHAVAAARLDGHWLMLDNRRMAMVEDDAAQTYQPLFVLYQSAVMQSVDEPVRLSMARAQGADEEDVHRVHRRQPLGVSPVSFLNAAAKAVCEE